MSAWVPCLDRQLLGSSGVELRIGHGWVDDYLRFVAARCRPNTVLAVGFDLVVFFRSVAKDPADVTASDVLEFLAEQRMPRRGNVVRLDNGEAGMSARTIRRRLSSLSGLFGYLVARGDLRVSPVQGGITTRGTLRQRSVPLIRTPRTLPRVLSPDEVSAF